MLFQQKGNCACNRNIANYLGMLKPWVCEQTLQLSLYQTSLIPKSTVNICPYTTEKSILYLLTKECSHCHRQKPLKKSTAKSNAGLWSSMDTPIVPLPYLLFRDHCRKESERQSVPEEGRVCYKIIFWTRRHYICNFSPTRLSGCELSKDNSEHTNVDRESP